jgi:hypothetical protein
LFQEEIASRGKPCLGTVSGVFEEKQRKGRGGESKGEANIRVSKLNS